MVKAPLHSNGAASRPAALLRSNTGRYSPSARLAGRAHRHSRCNAGFHHGLLALEVVAESTAGWIEATHGAIDILVNNAAVLINGDGLGVTTEDFAGSLAVNTVAPFALIRALGPGMLARKWGRIVNVSSGWGAFAEGMQGPVAYAASKAALNAVTCASAQTLGPTVKVNAACPGWVQTRMGGPGANRSPEQGADTPLWLATLPDDGPTGGFFRDRHPIAW
ncbi:MAG: SDR family NAD(P)-dependent oxidoreductase [Acidobacteria bacterium]|nr:SDR family NAD(P)-dependent oxidoreductase [Acidobacteriota bacterium]